MLSTRSRGSSRGSQSSRNVRRGSSAETTTGARNSVPSSSATPTARPSWVIRSVTWAPEPDLGAVRLGGAVQHLGEAAVAALVERPRAEVAVVLAHLVEQQHQARAGRHRADLGADDRRRGVVALDRLVLEVVLEPVRGAAGEQPHHVVHGLPVDPAEVVDQPLHVDGVLGIGAEDVGRRVVEERADRLAHPVEVAVVALVGVGVARRVPADLLEVLLVVVAEQQVVAVTGRVERRRHHQRQEAVLHEVELVDDLRPEQAQGVRERRELEPGHQLLGDRRAPDAVVLLEHQGAQPRLREVRRVGEPVVAAADDDRVVLVAHAFFLSGSKNGIFVVWMRTVVLWWLTASSSLSSVPSAPRSGRTRAMPMCRCSTGE